MIKKEKISVSKFVNKYNKQATDNLKAKYMNDTLDVKSYIPFIDKVTLCRKVVNSSSYSEDKKNVYYDSPASYLLYSRAIIDAYTNLTIESDNFLDEYDLLCSSGVLYVIVSALIPETELKEFNTIYQMVKNDFDKNNYEMHGFITKQINRLDNILGFIIDEPIKKKISSKILEFIK